jgi:hypothetical protein
MQFSNDLGFKAQTEIALLAPIPPANIAFPTDDQIKAAKHREIARHYARPRRKRSRPGIGSLIIGDLEKFFDDKYGSVFPDDDAGRGDLVVLLQYMAQLGDPCAMTACAARWCPWITDAEYIAMIAGIERAPMRWRADALASEIGLNRATRTRLGITTIGATDFGKAKRTKLRKKGKRLKMIARRAEAGAASHAVSAARLKPWVDQGMSRATWYRLGKPTNETRKTDSYPAAFLFHGAKSVLPADQGASPSGDLTRSACGDQAAAAENQSVVFEAFQTKRDSADAGRLCMHWRKGSKNPFESLPPATPESTEMDRAAA